VPKARRTVRLWRTYPQTSRNHVVPKARRTVRPRRTHLKHRGIRSCQRHDVACAFGARTSSIEESGRAKGTTYPAPSAHVPSNIQESCRAKGTTYRAPLAHVPSNIQESCRAKGTTYRAPSAHAPQASRNQVVPKARRSVRLWRTHLKHRGIRSCQRHDVPCAFGARTLKHPGIMSCQRHDVPCAFGARTLKHPGIMSCQRHDVPCAFGARTSSIEESGRAKGTT